MPTHPCPFCCENIPRETRLCPFCGEKLASAPDFQPGYTSHSPRNPESNRVWMVAALLGIPLAVAVTLLMVRGNDAGRMANNLSQASQALAVPAVPSPDRAVTVSPSFDCNKATHADEFMICSNNDLAELDNLVAAGYGYLAQTRGAKTTKPIGLRLWRSRQACGADADCIRERQIAAIRTYQDYGAPIELPTWAGW